MARNPLAAYKRTWRCRISGHAEAITDYPHKELGYCRRCFLPTSAKLAEDMEEMRLLLKEASAIKDLERMTGGSGTN